MLNYRSMFPVLAKNLSQVVLTFLIFVDSGSSKYWLTESLSFIFGGVCISQSY